MNLFHRLTLKTVRLPLITLLLALPAALCATESKPANPTVSYIMDDELGN